MCLLLRFILISVPDWVVPRPLLDVCCFRVPYVCRHINSLAPWSCDSNLESAISKLIDAEVNARITHIHELLRVRDGLDCICEFTKNDTEEFLGHICTF